MLRNTLYTTLLLILQGIFLVVSAQECGYVYVTPNGAASGAAGTRANPANLTYGLTLLSPSNNIMRLAEGTYTITSPVNIAANTTLEGGFDATTWIKSNANITNINRTSANVQPNPNRLVALSAINVNDFNLLDLKITIDDAVGNGVSTYGIYISDCFNYVVSRCVIDMGKGSDGAAGLPGTGGLPGANGTNGEPGEDEGNCCRLGGIGGNGSFAGSNAGGNGGLGANRGAFDIDTNTVPIVGTTVYNACCDYSNDGPPGQSGAGQGGGQGGTGGQKLCELTYANTNCMADIVNQGGTGANGANGITGLPGFQGIATHTGGFYVPGTGQTGQGGVTNGAGGGGGGGGGAKGCEPAVINPLDGDTVYYTSGSGGGGGGGGEGGQSGGGGSGGNGGGGAFGIYINNSGINGLVQDCFYILAPGGQGGAGGLGGPGGVGGQGGIGGYLGNNGPTNSCNTGRGGNGGGGGTGGQGGQGGQGSNGASIGLYQDPNGVQVLNPNSYNPFAPEVSVDYFGCTRANVIVNTNATGLINWLYGYNANPPLADVANDTIMYSGTGLRSITLIVDGVPYNFANFVNINTPFVPPVITASNTTVCAGGNISFSTSSTMQSYSWTFPTGSPATSSSQNPGAVTFNTPGTYQVRLTSTSCCGTSDTTITIKVLNSVDVNLPNDTALCFTDALPLLDAGFPNATYQWTLNGSPVGGNTQTLQTNGPGLYAVTVDYGQGCTGTDTYDLDINTFLTVNLATDTTAVCIGAPLPVLNVNIPNSNYVWRLNGNPVGANAPTLQTTLPGEYTITVTSPTGCFGSDTTLLLISDPSINLGVDQGICSNDPRPILDAGNPGSDYVWTLNGSPIGGNTQTITTSNAGTYEVNITNPFGCPASDDFVLTINPSIAASISCPPTVLIGQTINFTPNTVPAAQDWIWNFGDNTLPVNAQNTSHAYDSAGVREVFMIASNGLCSDTAYCFIDVQYDCATLGLNADFTVDTDTVDLSGFGYAQFTDLTTPFATGWIWNFGDGGGSNQQNPVHLYQSTGLFNVQLIAYNYNCTTQVTLPVVVINTGVAEVVKDKKVVLYPNPAQSEVYLKLDLDGYQQASVLVYDATGKLLDNYSIAKGNNLVTMPVKDYTNGLYFYRIAIDGELYYAGKFLVSR